MFKKYIPKIMISLSNSQSRYLISLLLTFTFSCSFSRYHTDILNVPASIAILLTAYNLQEVTFFLGVCMFTLVLLYIFQKHKHVKYYIMVSNMLSLLSYKAAAKENALDISGALMLLVIKGYYLGKEYNDTIKIEKVLSYMFLVPGIMMGPVMSLKEYTEGNRKYSLTKGTRKVVSSFVFLILHVIMTEKYNYVDIPKNSNFVGRLAMLVMLCVVHKCKYYFAWTFSEGCYAITGMDNVKNVKPILVEFSDSIKEIQNGWNIYTNAWLKDSIFVPLKRFGYLKASMATFFVSALWHGINPCYFMMFMTFSISVPLMKNNTFLMERWIGERGTRMINIVIMTLFVSYFSVPFFTLDIDELRDVWESVYFYGWIFLFISTVAYIFAKQKPNK